MILQSCKDKPAEVRLLFTGDILLARNVKTEIEAHKSLPFAGVDSLFKSSDLVFGNLEGAVGEGVQHALSDSGYPLFDIPRSYIPLLAQAGFTGLSIENNHSFDLGDSGKTETIKALQQAKLNALYYDNSPQFFTVKNITVAIVAINLIPGSNGTRQHIPSLEIKQKLRLAHSLSNMVVVFIHWGSELLEWPNEYQRKSAAWLTENGADMIIGCHPHVIQAPEVINGKPVFFSVGNHLFDQKYDATKQGLIVDCRIKEGYFICSGILTHTGKNSFYPEVTGTKQYNFKPVVLHALFQISGFTIKPVSAGYSDQNRIILQGYENNKMVFETHPMAITSIYKGRLDGKNDFLVALEKHPSNMDNEVNLRPYVYTVGKDGLTAKWRGSALAWPLLDAVLCEDDSTLCALHRGDSFIDLNPSTKSIRVQVYHWNGFGFSGVADTTSCKNCGKYFEKQ